MRASSEFARLVHERPVPMPAGLVPRRNNLDHGDNPVPAHMPDDHRTLLSAVELDVGLGHEAGSRPGEQCDRAGRFGDFIAPAA